MDGAALWIGFLVASLATHLPRGSFIVLGHRVKLPPAVYDALRYTPAAALAAIVAPGIFVVEGAFAPVNAKLIAGVVVVFVALRWRNPWLPFLVGMGVLLFLQKGIGL